MSGAEVLDNAAAAPAPRRTMAFRKYNRKPVPTPDQARRQNHIVQSAWRHFGEPGAAIAFLNTRHHWLDSHPLHLAIESDEGLARVETLLSEMTIEGQTETRICE
jgi:hypothetical protein